MQPKFKVGDAIFHNDLDEDLPEDARTDGRVVKVHPEEREYDIEYCGGGSAERVPENELEVL